MQNKNRKKLYNALRILWILTAFAAIILLVVYFLKIDGMNGSGKQDADGNGSLSGTVTPEITPAPTPEVTVEPQITPAPSDDPSGTQKPEATPSPTATPTVAPTVTEPPQPTPTAVPAEASTIDGTKPLVALTFDDGPSDAATRRILEALDKYKVKATFFMVGYNIDRLPDIVKEVYDAGHQIANHTQNHADLTKSDKKKRKSEVWGNNDKLNEIAPVGDTLLRPPYGSYNDKLKETVGTPMVCWSVDSLDWKSRDRDSVVKEVMTHVRDGYIVLMHDLYTSTADAVEIIIPKLLEEGYQIVTVSELFEARGVSMENGHVYRSCTPTPTPPPTPTAVPEH